MEGLDYNYFYAGCFISVAILIFRFAKRKKLNLGYKRLRNGDYRLIRNAIMNLSPRDFEIFMSVVFKMLGYRAKLTPYERDGGKDIILNNKIFVECKRYSPTTYADREVLQKLCGACVEAGIKEAIVANTGIYSKNAVRYADSLKWKGVRIHLWNLDNIMLRIKEIDSSEILEYLNIIEDVSMVEQLP